MADSRPLTEHDERVWHVRLEELSVRVRAAYPTADEKLPGWTVLKDHRHKVTCAVRDEAVLYIEREDAVVSATAASENRMTRQRSTSTASIRDYRKGWHNGGIYDGPGETIDRCRAIARSRAFARDRPYTVVESQSIGVRPGRPHQHQVPGHETPLRVLQDDIHRIRRPPIVTQLSGRTVRGRPMERHTALGDQVIVGGAVGKPSMTKCSVFNGVTPTPEASTPPDAVIQPRHGGESHGLVAMKAPKPVQAWRTAWGSTAGHGTAAAESERS